MDKHFGIKINQKTTILCWQKVQSNNLLVGCKLQVDWTYSFWVEGGRGRKQQYIKTSKVMEFIYIVQ